MSTYGQFLRSQACSDPRSPDLKLLPRLVRAASAPKPLQPAPEGRKPTDRRRMSKVNPSGTMPVVVLEHGRAERHYWRDLWAYRELFAILA